MDIHSAIELIASASNGEAVDFSTLKMLYKRAAFSCHPDRNGSIESAISMKALNAAWDFVSSREALVNQTLNGTANNVCTSEVYDPIESHELTHSPLPTFSCRETLINEAFNIVNDENWNLWCDVRFKTVYFSKYQIKLHTYASSIRITTLSNALEARKTCDLYTIQLGHPNDDGYCRFLDWVNSVSPDGDITGVLAHLYIANYQERRDGVMEAELVPGISVTRRDLMSTKVFSPFKLHKLKPLTEIPAKFRANHLIKILANGQYRQLHQSERLTDDYAFDAATKFGAMVLENPLPLLVSLIEDLSGGFYIIQRGSGSYWFGDHMNDTKLITPVIDNRFPAVDLLTGMLTETKYIQ